MKVITLFVLLVFPALLFAQTNNAALVDDIYQRASTFYDSGKYQEAITLLDRAEKVTGAPDAKILYLKSKALAFLVRQDNSYLDKLKQTTSAFAEVAVSQKYDIAKIQEIATLQKQISDAQFVKENERINSEQQSKAVALKKEENLRLYEQENKLLAPDFEKASRLMKRSGVVKRIFGGLLVGYGLFSYYTVSKLINKTSSNYYVYEPTTRDYIRMFAPTFTGVFLLATPSGRKRGNELQRRTLEKQRILQQKYLSFSPVFSPAESQYGLTLRLRY